MATSTEHKVRPLSAVESELDRTSRGNPSILARKNIADDTSSGNMVGWVIFAIVIIVGGYLFYSYQSPSITVTPTINKTDVAPTTIAPVPAVPPASTTVTPPAATPPATTTTP